LKHNGISDNAVVMLFIVVLIIVAATLGTAYGEREKFAPTITETSVQIVNMTQYSTVTTTLTTTVYSVEIVNNNFTTTTTKLCYFVSC